MTEVRVVQASHATREIVPDPEFEVGLSAYLRRTHDLPALLALYGRFAGGQGEFDGVMRRAVWRSVARQFGNGVVVGVGVGFQHLETFEIGDGVFIGAQAYLQGRFDGTCRVGSRTWIGPQVFIDARDVSIGQNVGIGPGVRILGSVHTGVPYTVPVIATDLEIRPVRVEDEADIGTSSTILPGVRLGRGCLVGAGAVVTHGVAPYAVVAGVPARFLRWREGYTAACES